MNRRLTGSLLLACLVACAAAPAVRKITYAPDLRYLAGRQVTEIMQVLAKASVELDALLREEPKEGPETVDVRAEVIRLLMEMEKAASDLDRGPTTNHPVLDENLGLFRQDLEAAREAAEYDPPNYFLAGSVAGSCLLYCHTGDRAGERR